MAERFSCARLSQRLGEPLLGTASTVTRWLLIEQPGPWGRDALPESGLGADLGNELKRRCRDARVRPLLIRRTGGGDSSPRTAYLASSRAGWTRRLSFEAADELLDVDLSTLDDDTSAVGAAVDAPLLLTCTNGRHDACCAEYGRPIAEAVAAAAGGHAWEVSHIGGDRFAANVLWLPAGVYYGRVTLDDVPLLAELTAQRRLSLDHYRGRSTLPFAAQAAEIHLRRELGCDGLEELTLEQYEVEDQRARVVFEAANGGWVVQLTVAENAEPQQLTCQATRSSRPARYREIRIDRLGGR